MHVLRKLSFAIGLVTVMAMQHAMALGLGAAEVKSALNQPLEAEIRLTSVEDMTGDDLIVRLASVSAFENAGITRLEFYNRLNFELRLDHESGPLVRVTTREPVREPYLNFLVEARWASGRLMREYTLLLDLPIFEEDRAQAPVQAAPRERTATRPSTRAQESQSAASALRPETPTAAAGAASSAGNVYGPVAANDTLWEIALQVRPGRDLSVQQTMLAIQRANPDAFINGNINLLRRGQVLRIPSRADIQSLGRTEAVRQVAQHNRDWNETRGVQLDAGRRLATQPREAGEVTGQVTLASATGAVDGGAGQSGGASDASGRELQGQLDATLEELDKTRSENRELSARVRDLEAQIDTMESLVQASNEQLRALQLAAEQTRQQSTADTEQPARDFMPDLLQDEESAAELAQEEQPPAEQEQGTEETVVEDEPEVATTPVARDPTRVVRSAPPPPSIMDRVMENLLAIIGGLLVVILAAAYFIQRRKQAAAESDDEFDEDFDEDDFLAADVDQGEFQEEGDEFDRTPDAEHDAYSADDLTSEDTGGAEAETGDVVSEAEIYIAYGKPEQAEEMLLKGLANEPGSAPILGKLLEVYAETQNIDDFDQYYGALLSTGDQAAIQRAAELRANIAGAGEFNADAYTAAETITPKADDLSLGSLELEDDKLEGDEAIADSDDDELTFGEDLSFDLEDDEPTPLETAEKDLQAASSRYDLSFDEQGEEADDELTFDLDLESLTDDAETTGASNAAAELDTEPDAGLALEPGLELDEDAFELDTELELEPILAPEPQIDSQPEPEAPAAPANVESGADDDFSFDLDAAAPAEDFDSLDSDLASLDGLLGEDAATPALELDDNEDFDPSLDVSGVDLDALDKEMDALDEVDVPEAPVESAPLDIDTDETPFEFGEDDAAAEPASDEDMDAELDFLADADEAATKLDLARAYIDMGDTEGAKDILSEVSQEGNDEQKREAGELLTRIE